MEVQGLTNSSMQSGVYALILAENNGSRRLPVAIGEAEAQSIAIVMENVKPPRPMTHDLFMSVVKSCKMRVVEVFIYRYADGIFYSDMLIEKENGQQIAIDSRTSDGVAVAMRAESPIYVAESVLDEHGIQLEDVYTDEENDDEEDDCVGEEGQDDADVIELLPLSEVKDEDIDYWLSKQNDADLKIYLSDAIDKENYEQAKIVRDELLRRGIEV